MNSVKTRSLIASEYGIIFDNTSDIPQIYQAIDAPVPHFTITNSYHSAAQREVAHDFLIYIALVVFGVTIGCHTAGTTFEFILVIAAGAVFALILALFSYHEARRAFAAETTAEKDALAASLLNQRRSACVLRRQLESNQDGLHSPEYRFLVDLMDAIDNPPASL